MTWWVFAAVLLTFDGHTIVVQANNWTTDDIDDWIRTMEDGASMADWFGDHECREALWDSAYGLGAVRDRNGIHWDPTLPYNAETLRYRSTREPHTININPQYQPPHGQFDQNRLS